MSTDTERMRGNVIGERVNPVLTGDEKTTLESFLDYYRATLAVKCEGLSDDQLRERSAPPSSLSLLGLVRHMAEVERSWFRRRITGEDLPFRYWTEESPDADFDDVDTADVAEAFAAWHDEIERARRISAAAPLDDTFDHPRLGQVSVRWVLVHMIEEYARHAGHADLLRERIDGATGD